MDEKREQHSPNGEDTEDTIEVIGGDRPSAQGSAPSPAEEAAAQEGEAQGERGTDGKKNWLVSFFADLLRGVAIGIAFIIPGFSGGSVAAILGIYEKLVGAIADFFKSFRRSVAILFPVLLGMILGIAVLILPIQWGLDHYPMPTVSLFVGLALGGLPAVKEKIPGRPTWKNAVVFLLPCALAACLCFLPAASRPEGFLFRLDFGGYLLLVLIGVVGSCALVVPGISGSMLLLIFGYYRPLVSLVTEHLLRGDQVGVSLLVLACAGAGILVGFFAISVLMRWLLRRFPRGTYYAILGFIVGSVVAVYATTVKDGAASSSAAALTALYSQPWYWVVTVLFFLAGIALSLLLVFYARRRGAKGKD